ncbi:hypothetical protein, partial [Succinimonas amylolytica]|uniref:hypothetical protein n=1 Tax=Succinimonas amylolytica TaxID=83769 RepID=UPI0023A819CF
GTLSPADKIRIAREKMAALKAQKAGSGNASGSAPETAASSGNTPAPESRSVAPETGTLSPADKIRIAREKMAALKAQKAGSGNNSEK